MTRFFNSYFFIAKFLLLLLLNSLIYSYAFCRERNWIVLAYLPVFMYTLLEAFYSAGKTGPVGALKDLRKRGGGTMIREDKR